MSTTRGAGKAPLVVSSLHRGVHCLWNAAGKSRSQRRICPQPHRPTPLRECQIPLQMAQKDVFTTDVSTGGGTGPRVVESGRMAQLASIHESAAIPPQNLEAEESVLGA